MSTRPASETSSAALYGPPLSTLPSIHQAAHEIAYCTSRTDIECMCACAGGGPDKGGWWWRIDRVAVKDDRQWVERAVRYLNAVGLLEHDPKNPNRVRIRDR